MRGDSYTWGSTSRRRRRRVRTSATPPYLPYMLTSVSKFVGPDTMVVVVVTLAPLVPVDNHQLLRGKSRENCGAVVGDNDFFFDTGRGDAIRSGAERLESKDHAGLQFNRVGETVEATDHRTLVQSKAEAMAELQTEGRHLVGEAKLSCGGTGFGDHVGASTGADQIDGLIHPLACLGVGVALRAGRTADGQGPVVTRAVTVERTDDVKECLVAGTDNSVGEVVRVRVAPLTRDCVNCLDLVGTHLVESLVGERDDLVLTNTGLEGFEDVLIDTVDHCRGL